MANNAEYANNEDNKVRHRMAEALANLAEATTSDKTAVANLSESNTKLANEVINLAKQVKDKDTQMEKMQKSINDLMVALQNLSHAPDASAGFGTATGTKKFYCWTH
eukprot:9575025-Ditylum_brightwellii.AAC.1